jgi:peptide chain release factor
MSWLLISSGTGPDECHIAVKKLAQYIIKEHKDVYLLDSVESNHGLFSCLLSGNQEILQQYAGTIKWICESPIRKNWKRKNWFVTCEIFEDIEKNNININLNDIKFEAVKASGPGGQHVNKTESAIRATYMPNGITVFAQEERSQHQNKRLAIARLIKKIENKKIETLKENTKKQWETHNSLIRGNEIMTFKNINFKQI